MIEGPGCVVQSGERLLDNYLDLSQARSQREPREINKSTLTCNWLIPSQLLDAWASPEITFSFCPFIGKGSLYLLPMSEKV